MRNVIYGAACSLDGFIAGPKDEVDWLHWNDDVAALSASTFEAVDTVIMGRRTYEVALRMGTRAYPGVRNIVFSRSLEPGPDTAVEIVRDDAPAVVRALREGQGMGICVMGGGRLAASLLNAGLVDEIGVNIHPIILGSGVPFLAPVAGRHELDLVDRRDLPDGCVYALYRIRRSGIPVHAGQ